MIMTLSASVFVCVCLSVCVSILSMSLSQSLSLSLSVSVSVSLCVRLCFSLSLSFSLFEVTAGGEMFLLLDLLAATQAENFIAPEEGRALNKASKECAMTV